MKNFRLFYSILRSMGENITQNSGFTGNAEEKFSWDVTHMSKK